MTTTKTFQVIGKTNGIELWVGAAKDADEAIRLSREAAGYAGGVLDEGMDEDEEQAIEVVVGAAKDVFELRTRGVTADGRPVVSDGACLVAPRHAEALKEEIAVRASLQGEARAEKVADLYATWCRDWDVEEVSASEVLDG